MEFLKIGREKFPVATLREASQVYELARDLSGKGASGFPSGLIVDHEGKTVASISYNGRVWGPGPWVAGQKPLFEPGQMPTPAELGAGFVRVLKEWIKEPGYWDGDYSECETAEQAWAKMCADNAAETNPHVCHSHDWCDANMAMDEAMRNLGLGARLDQEAGMSEEINALWNAAWESARPALKGDQ